MFTLNEEQFQLLYLCLHKENILQNTPLTIKTDSVVAEESITKKFYSDYSQFKRELFRDLVKQNLKNEVFRTELQKEDKDRVTKNIKLSLFKKSQKLIDRFLFIFFAEDKGLLPPNSTLQILNKWKADWDFGDERPLYDLFKQYFKFLDIGRKGTQSRAEIFAYNGGLFKPDPILDSLILDNQILYKHTKTLSDYDFESQVGVNILGHIFENSLNEIESVNAEIEGKEFDKQKTKRKKDGVFYTPKYITKYIVDNTVGKLCDEKKLELEIKEEEYRKNRKGRKTETLKKLQAKLNNYRSWLLSLTILDPACGSGAFLNQALDFLIKEHHYIDELETSLVGGSMVFQNIENTILENNIYGVDLNEESVEIAKLSLWLHTAQPRRKLNSLNNNIKCGNSLIDDPKVAGDKAFNWQNEFPNIFNVKKKKVWHITTATHNSRYSQRMFDNNVKTGEAIRLDEKDEIIITEIIAEIVKESKFDDNEIYAIDILEYNICGDHMHLLLVCEEEELTKIVGKIKAVSGRRYNIEKGITRPANATSKTRGHVPLSDADTEEKKEKKKYNSLWTQKFGKSEIKDENYLNNTIEYICNNRVKHELPKSKEIEKLKKEFLCSTEHAFRTEYNGGFDVVIGNPPYLAGREWSDELRQQRPFFEKKFSTMTDQYDLYALFIQKCFDLIHSDSLISLITPNTWFMNEHYLELRRWTLDKYDVNLIGDFVDVNVFKDATVLTVIFFLSKKKNKEKINIQKFSSESEYIGIESSRKIWNRSKELIFNLSLSEDDINIMERVEKSSSPLSEYANVKFGVKAYQKGKGKPKQDGSEAPIKKFESNIKEEFDYFPYLHGKDISNFYYKKNLTFLKYGKHLAEPRNIDLFKGGRVLVRRIVGNKLIVCPIEETIIADQLLHSVKLSKGNYLIIGILLQSKLMSYYFKKKYNRNEKTFPEIRVKELGALPINYPIDDSTFTVISIRFLNLNREIKDLVNKFTKYLQSQLSIDKLSKNLQNWHELEFSEFIKELNKAIKKVKGEKLTKSDEMEWMDVFETKKAEAQTLKSEIEKTDREIDQMVYELYGLSEEEIKIVEGDI